MLLVILTMIARFQVSKKPFFYFDRFLNERPKPLIPIVIHIIIPPPPEICQYAHCTNFRYDFRHLSRLCSLRFTKKAMKAKIRIGEALKWGWLSHLFRSLFITFLNNKTQRAELLKNKQLSPKHIARILSSFEACPLCNKMPPYPPSQVRKRAGTFQMQSRYFPYPPYPKIPYDI